MAIINNLYPPIMPNIIPAFIRNKTCKVYFSLSEYNTIKDIANVQVTLTNIKTNLTVFNTTKYPTGIKLTTLHYDNHIEGEYCYYINIFPNDLKDGAFQLNQYYKIQLRFTSVKAEPINISQNQAIATWLMNNMSFFSEWSQVCLLKGISQPILSINHLKENQTTILEAPLSIITGKLNFQEAAEQDHLTEYFIKIYRGDRTEKEGLIFDSGIIHTNLKPTQENLITCSINCNFEPNKSYIIKINYTTKFLYNQEKNYNIKMSSRLSPNPFNIIISTSPNSEEGYIHVKIKINTNSDITKKKILLRRSSSRNNFQTWEDIYLCQYFFTSFSWQDLSIESGVWYKYGVYILDSDNILLYSPTVSQPIMCIFDDIFLISDNIQFKLQFNPIVSDFKYNINEIQQLTLGSKFPYIKKNGNNYYRTFSISGLISSLIDDTSWYDSYIYPNNSQNVIIPFASKEKVYGGNQSKALYEQQEDNNKYLNPYFERFFRELVYDFLYSENVKLFRSPTEGNILVRLTNITFTPITSLGRVLYSFSANAVEIDDANITNYKKYNIFPDSIFEIVTESPQIEAYKDKSSNLVLVINANGANQKMNQNWTLHLESREARGGKLT